MHLFRRCRSAFTVAPPSFVHVSVCAIVLAGALSRAADAQTSSTKSEVRVFFGYENQRADLTPTSLSTLDGVAVSLERLVPPDPGSLILDIRGGYRSGSFPGECEALPTPPCVPPTLHSTNVQFLLLGGIRGSVNVRGGRVFFDGLGGAGYWSASTTGSGFIIGGNESQWSPAVEGGAGFDARIRPRLDARVRASLLFTDFDDEIWQTWRHHLGLSAGIVLRP